ncbi:MAG: PEP-CTERM sorting domain-containing protein [Akkermansiaceae bacterium]|nr:PEP-CTERM sorting domain-containing protein [Akkermansiaceae bacterium]
MKITTGILATIALTLATSQAAVLYNIASFNSDATTSGSINWITGKTTITTAAGYTGTTDPELRTNANTGGLNPDGFGGYRFRNSESHNANYGTVTADPGSGGTAYFSFGVSANSGTFDLASLTFEARASTGNNGVGRGYSVVYAINGSGVYNPAGAATVFNGRNSGNFDSIDLTLTDTGITSVDFRITSTSGGIEYRNFTINAVPEPSSAALLGLGGLALVLRRRR